jgi:hypothetical protein
MFRPITFMVMLILMICVSVAEPAEMFKGDKCFASKLTMTAVLNKGFEKFTCEDNEQITHGQIVNYRDGDIQKDFLVLISMSDDKKGLASWLYLFDRDKEKNLARSRMGSVLQLEIVNGVIKVWADPELDQMVDDVLNGRTPTIPTKRRQSI